MCHSILRKLINLNSRVGSMTTQVIMEEKIVRMSIPEAMGQLSRAMMIEKIYYKETPFWIIDIRDYDALRCDSAKFVSQTFGAVTEKYKRLMGKDAWICYDPSISIPEFRSKIVVFKNNQGEFVVLRDSKSEIVQIE